MNKRTIDFDPVMSVSTTDQLLIWQSNQQKRGSAGQLATLLNANIYLSSLADVSVGGPQDNEFLRYDATDGKWVPTSITAVDTSAITQAISVLQVSVAALNSTVAVISANVTSVYNLVSNTTSVLNARITSVQAGSTSVDARVTSLRTDITSVESRVNAVSNAVSVVDARVTSVKNDLNITSAALRADITSVYDYVSNQVSVLGDRVTSVHNEVSALASIVAVNSAQMTSVTNAIPRKLVSLADVSAATGAGTNGYSLTWDNAQSKFVLASISGGGGGTPLSVWVSSFSGDGTATTIVTQNSITDKSKGFLFIEGVYQNKSTYTVSGATIVVTSGLPPGTDNIEWVYLDGGSGGGGGGDIASVDARVTSVNSYFLNQVSVLSDRVTSVETHVNTVSNAVSVLAFDSMSGMIPVVSIQRYDLDRRAFRKYAIRSVFAATSTGECTYSLRRNGSNLTGFTSITASVNTSVVTSGTITTIDVGDRFDLNVTTNVSAFDYSFTIGLVKL